MESSTAISVQWGPVEPCADQNGPITGYSVIYGEMGSGSTQNKTVSGEDSRMATISELTKETVYTVEVAAKTRAGTGVYSLPLTIQTPDSECVPVRFILSHILTDVYLSLNGTVIPNHGYVEISGIGYYDYSAFLCHTNQPPPPGSYHSGGDWFAPDGTNIPSSDVPGVTRNRGPMVMRLKRTSGTPPQGIYRCSLEGDSSEVVHVHVGLYNSAQGSIQCLFNDY